MGVKVELEGLAEFREALRHMPEALRSDAATIVEAHATQAQREVSAAYTRGKTGNLKSRVRVTHNAGRRFSAASIVKSAAPHASIFEFGTVRRTTDRGANRGRMPEAPASQAMVPIIVRARRRMVQALIGFLRDQGFVIGAQA